MKEFLWITTIGSVLAALAASPAAAASGKSCTCQNLESLQQETKNAAYSEQFYRDMAGKLKALEDHLRDLKKNHPTDPDASLDIFSTSGPERERIVKTFLLPHQRVKGKTGPDQVTLPFGSCKNIQADLDGLAKGASCKEIGDIVLAHEAKHRAICDGMGADTYWSRMPSELAAEEADRYSEQAKAMRKQLKRVIDGATVEIDSTMTSTMKGPQSIRTVIKQVMEKIKIRGQSSPGSDRWELKGEGVSTRTIESFTHAHLLRGTTSGALKDAQSMTLKMDGFKMSLDIKSKSLPGDVKINSLTKGGGVGWSQSMRPVGETGSGTVFTDLPVQLETMHKQNDSIMAGPASVSSDHATNVTISCPAP